MLPNSPIVFVRARRAISPLERNILIALFVVIAGIFSWMWQWEIIDPALFMKAILGPAFPGLALLLGFSLFAGLAQLSLQKSMQSARLVLDGEGIRIEIEQPGTLLNMVFKTRQILWSELEKVSYLRSYEVLQLRAKKVGSPPLTLGIRDWKLSDQFSSSTTATRKITRANSDLLRVFREHGIFDTHPADPRLAAADFDLISHPVSRMALIAMGILAVYGLIDGMMQKEGWAFFNLVYCLPHIVVGAIVSGCLGLFFLFMKSNRLPDVIALILALLMGFTAGFASYIGGIRINQLAGNPLVDVPYHRNASCDALIPEDKTLPVIEYTELAQGYWCSIPPSEAIQVRIRKGLFGLYQANLSSHTQAIAEYRRDHPSRAKNKPASSNKPTPPLDRK